MDAVFVPLRVIGITYNQIENGMYALVLEEIGGSLRFPIIVGYTEAQAIECLLQKIATPRPLTHEFIARTFDSFEISIKHVLIKQLPNGIFTADITLCMGDVTHVLDARSSDAIALAMRLEAPIFTTRKLLDSVGIERDSISPRITHQSIPARQAIARMSNPHNSPFANVSDERLIQLMEKAVDDEDYEKADKIKSEIRRRNSEK